METLTATRREDGIAALTGLLMVLGLVIDGWNHINRQDGALGGFFTPYHGLLYIGFTATGAWLLHRTLGNDRYPTAVPGLLLAMAGMVGDLVWHTLFGEEQGIARVIAPFHLLLFTGALLVLAAPLVSAWRRPAEYPAEIDFRGLAPAWLSLTLLATVVAFGLQWVSVFVDWTPPAAGDDAAELARVVGVVRVLLTNAVLVVPVLVARRRWRLFPGAIASLSIVVAVLVGSIAEFRAGGAVLGIVVGALLADVAHTAVGDRVPMRWQPLARGGVIPLVTWSAYFVVAGAAWPADLALGTVGLASLSGVAFAALINDAPIFGGHVHV